MQKDEISHKTKQSLLWFTILPFSVHFVRFANSIILARILSPDDFGIVGIATVLLYYCSSFTNFGFSTAIIQRKDISEHHYNSFFCFNLFISVLFFLLFGIFSNDIALFFHEPRVEPAIELCSLLFLINSLLAIPLAIQKRYINYKLLAQAEAAKVFISMTISLTLALHGFEFWSIIYSMVISNLVAMIVIRLSTSVEPRLSFKYSYFKDLMSFGIWNFILGQSNIFRENVDKVLIGHYLDTSRLGFYEKGYGLAKMPNEQIANRISTVSFSSFSRIQSDPDLVKQYFSKIMTLNAFLCFPLFIGLATVSENFTLVLLGEKWEDMIPILSIFSISFLITSTLGPIYSMNVATGYIKHQVLINVFWLVLLIFTLLLIVPYGIVITAYSILTFNLFLFLSSSILLQKITKLTWYDFWVCIKPATVSTSTMLAVLILFSRFLLINNQALNLICSIFLGILTYAMCVILIPFEQWQFIRNKSMHLIKSIRLKLKPKP